MKIREWIEFLSIITIGGSIAFTGIYFNEGLLVFIGASFVFAGALARPEGFRPESESKG